jgi:hypothetical protein
MIRKLFQNEDLLSFTTGLLIILLSIAGVKFGAAKFSWTTFDELGILLTSGSNLLDIGFTAVALVLLGLTTKALRRKQTFTIFLSILLLFAVSPLSQFISGFKPVKYYGFEYVIFTLGIAWYLFANIKV